MCHPDRGAPAQRVEGTGARATPVLFSKVNPALVPPLPRLLTLVRREGSAMAR